MSIPHPLVLPVEPPHKMESRRSILGLSLGAALLVVGLSPAYAKKSLQSAPPPVSDLQKTLTTCFACHGKNGVSTMPSRPSIAGQKGSYIAKQLTAFMQAAQAHQANQDLDADDAATPIDPVLGPLRKDPVMEHMVKGLDAQMVVKISEAVSKLACRSEEAPVKSVSGPTPQTTPAALGECHACHGADGRGARPDVPILAGQQRAYLRRQLLLIRESAWGALPREGESARSHPIMERQVARLKIQDVDALAQYYSRLDCRPPKLLKK